MEFMKVIFVDVSVHNLKFPRLEKKGTGARSKNRRPGDCFKGSGQWLTNKQGGSGIWLLLEDGLGLWRLMTV
jgi:hypothetical protein